MNTAFVIAFLVLGTTAQAATNTQTVDWDRMDFVCPLPADLEGYFYSKSFSNGKHSLTWGGMDVPVELTGAEKIEEFSKILGYSDVSGAPLFSLERMHENTFTYINLYSQSGPAVVTCSVRFIKF